MTYKHLSIEERAVIAFLIRNGESVRSAAKAIGMGIITETTKLSLLALEAERNELEASLAKASLKSKRYTRDEIRLAISDLATCGGETEKQREALINAFVRKVTIETEGYIKVELCLFGHGIKSKSGDSGEISVRIKSALPRQLECIQNLYINKYGFGLEFRMTSKSKPMKFR